MANNASTNPIIIDTTGDVVTTPVKVKGITVHASADSWVVELRDTKASNNIVFSQTSAVTGDRGNHYDISPPTVWQGIDAQTLTNITRVLVHLA